MLEKKDDKFIKKYCTGCGLCRDWNNTSLQEDADGFLSPTQESIENKDFFVRVCPSMGHQTKDMSEEIWGHEKAVFWGYSRNPRIRLLASSGGMLTEIAIYLLKKKRVDGILHIGCDPETPYKTRLCCSTNSEEICRNMGSRYTVSAPLRDLKDSIRDDKTYAFIGKPCDVAALKNLMEIKTELKERIPITLSFFCAGMPGYTANKKLINQLIGNKNCVSLQYRGNGWPGKATAIADDGSVGEMEYEKSWGSILGRGTRPVCRFCIDGIGDLADISCADAWYLTAEKKPDFSEHPGRNLLYARSNVGREILESMQMDRTVFLGFCREHETLMRYMQPFQFRRRTTLRAMSLSMKLFGKQVPFYAPSLFKVWSRQGNGSAKRKIFLGTAKRILQKKI